MKHALVPFTVRHTRYIPKEYSFTHDFFWFLFDLDSPNKWPSFLVSFNSFNLYSFFDSDHMKLGGESARENFILFAQKNGLETEIKSVQLFTQLRFLGYVFNPVSFVVLTDVEDKQHFIIEIGNTFNELKPFFVHNKHMKNDVLTYKTKKYFYISPFIPHDHEMLFKVKCKNDKLSIFIDDRDERNSTLKVWLKGDIMPANNKNLILQTFKIPFSTFKTIFLIHWHALILWLKGIRFYKKDEYQDLQQGTLIWKTSKTK